VKAGSQVQIISGQGRGQPGHHNSLRPGQGVSCDATAPWLALSNLSPKQTLSVLYPLLFTVQRLQLAMLNLSLPIPAPGNLGLPG
jgi:hypothetical protein